MNFHFIITLILILSTNLSYATEDIKQNLCQLYGKNKSCNQFSQEQKLSLSSLEIQCESERQKHSCENFEKSLIDKDKAKKTEISAKFKRCNIESLCEPEFDTKSCAIAGLEGAVDLVVNLVTLPWTATRLIANAFENDKSCFENKNGEKENLFTLYNLSIPNEHQKYRIPEEMKANIVKNWSCSELRNYVNKKQQNYNSFLGPLIAQGKFNPKKNKAPIQELIEAATKQFELRWDCYSKKTKADLSCYVVANLLTPGALAKGLSILKVSPIKNISKEATVENTTVKAPAVVKLDPTKIPPTAEEILKNPQIGLWRLHEVGLTEQAQALESQITNTLLTSKPIDVTAVGKGIMGGKYLDFGNGVKGIWKPDSHWDIEGMGRHEVAAYDIDRKLGLRRVPITVKREYNGIEGSIQLVVNDLDDVKFGGHPSHYSFFDQLIGNKDRHAGNIISTEGRAIAIDNGLSFESISHIQFSTDSKNILTQYRKSKTEATKNNAINEMKYLMPQQAVYENLVRTTPEEWQQILGKNLGNSEIRNFLTQREFLIMAVENAKKTMGENIFPDGNFSPLIRLKKPTSEK